MPLDFRSFVADLKRRAGDIHGGTCNATVKHPLTTGTWMGSCNVTSRSPRGTQRRCHRNRLTFRKLGSSGIQKGLQGWSSGVFAVGLPQTEVFYRVSLVVKILSASRLSVIFISQRHLSRFSVIFISVFQTQRWCVIFIRYHHWWLVGPAGAQMELDDFWQTHLTAEAMATGRQYGGDQGLT